MPKENFYASAVEGDPPVLDLTVSWGLTDVPAVLIKGGGEFKQYDRSGLNRLIGVLRRARDQVYGADE